MNYPQYVKIKDKKYKINTDFRIAIKCNEIAEDEEIDGYEKTLAIIYLLFGDDGLNDKFNYDKLLELARKYLACGKEIKEEDNQKKDMDYIEDEGLIRSSFQYDYKYDPYDKEYVHWWKFYNDLSNLSNSEFGNCCVLNRVRNLRNMDLSEIKDEKTKNKIRKEKARVALKKEKRVVHKNFTDEEKRNMEEFYKQMGL